MFPCPACGSHPFDGRGEETWQPIGEVMQRIVEDVMLAGELAPTGNRPPPVARRYTWRLYPSPAQAERLHEQRRMIADLWNALLERWETVSSRTQQIQSWVDAGGKRHVGRSVHRPEWPSRCMADGRERRMPPDAAGRPKPFTTFDLQNEVTWLCNALPEWRELSVWCGLRTAALLRRAIDSFIRRAAKGGGRAGYPRYKPRERHDSIPHRFASGCKLTRRSPQPSVCRIVYDDRGRPIGPAQHATSWNLAVKGVPGWIAARGRLPADIEKFTDADILWRDGKWWLSAAVEIVRQRAAGARRLTVRLGVLDEFAVVDGIAETPRELDRALRLAEALDRLKAQRDERWPRAGTKHGRQDEAEYRAVCADARRLAGRIARIRRNALHVWTAGVIARAGDVTILMPPLREHLKTARGDARRPGAETAIVAQLNRTFLGRAPAMARDMLVYKAAEAGIRCDVIDDPSPETGIGGDLAAAGQHQRRARRAARRKGG